MFIFTIFPDATLYYQMSGVEDLVRKQAWHQLPFQILFFFCLFKLLNIKQDTKVKGFFSTQSFTFLFQSIRISQTENKNKAKNGV